MQKTWYVRVCVCSSGSDTLMVRPYSTPPPPQLFLGAGCHRSKLVGHVSTVDRRKREKRGCYTEMQTD